MDDCLTNGPLIVGGAVMLSIFAAALQAAAPTGSFPTWKHLSSANGDLPAPNGGKNRTSLLICDLDRDGLNDFVVAERSAAPAVVWLRRDKAGWTRHVIDADKAPLAAGGSFSDVDGDGDLDIVSKPFVWKTPRLDVWLNQ